MENYCGERKKKVTGLVALGRFTPIRSEHMFILTCVGGLGEPAGNYLYHINATSFCWRMYIKSNTKTKQIFIYLFIFLNGLSSGFKSLISRVIVNTPPCPSGDILQRDATRILQARVHEIRCKTTKMVRQDHVWNHARKLFTVLICETSKILP